MIARSITQIENDYAPRLPERSTFERLEMLFLDWRREGSTVGRKRIQLEMHDRQYRSVEDQASDRRNEIINQRTHAELRRAEIEKEIYNVARLLVAEAEAEVGE